VLRTANEEHHQRALVRILGRQYRDRQEHQSNPRWLASAKTKDRFKSPYKPRLSILIDPLNSAELRRRNPKIPILTLDYPNDYSFREGLCVRRQILEVWKQPQTLIDLLKLQSDLIAKARIG
jgi:hypothetical protein